MPWLSVNQTWLWPVGDVPTPDLALEVHRGSMPGAPGAMRRLLVMERRVGGRPADARVKARRRSAGNLPVVRHECTRMLLDLTGPGEKILCVTVRPSSEDDR